MKAPRKRGASKLKGHLMRFFRQPGFNPLVQAQPRAREMVRGAGRRDRTHLCLRPPLRKNRLGSGTDGRTDARSTQERVSGFWRGCARSEPQEVQREGGEGGAEPQHPQRTLPPYSRTFAFRPHFSARFLPTAPCRRCRRRGPRPPPRARLPATSPPCALRGDTFDTAAEGTAAVGSTGQGTGPGPQTRCIPGVLGGTWWDLAGDCHCHPCPKGRLAPGGTFGADELRVLLPGAAKVL